MVTRRTTQRMFLLLPGQAANQAFRYCLALAMLQSGVLVHAYCVLSNHYHIICSDPRGLLPKFSETLNGLLGRALNCFHGRWENFWAGSAQPSYVRLGDDAAVIEKTAYTLANPVEAALVKYGNDWPGERLYRPGTYVAKRPKFFFRNDMPESIKFELTPLPIAAPSTQATKMIEDAVRARESEFRIKYKLEGRSFMGARAVKAQNAFHAPRTREPRRGLSPRVATRDKWRRVEILGTLKRFVDAYRAALADWKRGVRDVLFPAGTYAMRVFHDCRCVET